MDSEPTSSVDEEALVAGTIGAGGAVAADTRGKHRILAELKRIEQEISFLERELDELEKTDNVSTVCEGFLRNVEMIPDPLLSITIGPANPIWDRWFEGAPDAGGCSCTIL
ncbi:Guanine nucleotide-binding protein subunit gamma 1 [Linum grandiflorum]